MTFKPISKEHKDDLDNCVKEMLEALPKKKQIEFLGHANELWVFIASVPREDDLRLNEQRK